MQRNFVSQEISDLFICFLSLPTPIFFDVDISEQSDEIVFHSDNFCSAQGDNELNECEKLNNLGCVSFEIFTVLSFWANKW